MNPKLYQFDGWTTNCDLTPFQHYESQMVGVWPGYFQMWWTHPWRIVMNTILKKLIEMTFLWWTLEMNPNHFLWGMNHSLMNMMNIFLRELIEWPLCDEHLRWTQNHSFKVRDEPLLIIIANWFHFIDEHWMHLLKASFLIFCKKVTIKVWTERLVQKDKV